MPRRLARLRLSVLFIPYQKSVFLFIHRHLLPRAAVLHAHRRLHIRVPEHLWSARFFIQVSGRRALIEDLPDRCGPVQDLSPGQPDLPCFLVQFLRVLRAFAVCRCPQLISRDILPGNAPVRIHALL